jgi:threonylcarbamoyladenosine tRNA methylthiotransferase MtaB
VQSGCDRTLKAMHRHYTCAEYEELVKQLRALFPYCAVTTDIMTGFPDETEEDFAKTLEFVKRVKFSQIHIFRYSPRSGTPAAKMKQIPEQIKKERSERLSQLSETLHREYLETCIGQVHRVLFERQKSPEWHNGHAENYVVVIVPAKEGENFRNQIFDVKITGLQGNQLIGEVIHNG